MITFKEILTEKMPSVEIEKKSSDEKNVSKRTVTYDVHVNGKYITTLNDINDASDVKKKLPKMIGNKSVKDKDLIKMIKKIIK